jgi:hypothetical protein
MHDHLYSLVHQIQTKLCHIDIHQMWLRQKVGSGRLPHLIEHLLPELHHRNVM